jgi:hypothetical protein
MELGRTKQELEERVLKTVSSNRLLTPLDRILDPVTRFIFSILHSFGITFPVLFWIHDPRRPVFSHQGTIILQPNTCKIFKFIARERGFLTVDADFVPLDNISSAILSINYFFNGQRNEPKDSLGVLIDPVTNTIIPMMRKFRKVLLQDRQVLEIQVCNISSTQQAAFDFNITGWEL